MGFEIRVSRTEAMACREGPRRSSHTHVMAVLSVTGLESRWVPQAKGRAMVVQEWGLVERMSDRSESRSVFATAAGRKVMGGQYISTTDSCPTGAE